MPEAKRYEDAKVNKTHLLFFNLILSVAINYKGRTLPLCGWFPAREEI
jgi:hypothetical protein